MQVQNNLKPTNQTTRSSLERTKQDKTQAIAEFKQEEGNEKKIERDV